MAANTQPIYSLTPDIQSVALNNSGLVVGPSANTAQDGTGANMWMGFQAGANGSYLQRAVFRPVGSPVATVCRVFICTNTGGGFTGGTTNTATNTMLVGEISLPLITLSQTVQTPTFELALAFALPISQKLCFTFGTSTGAAGTGYSVVTIGGDY